MLVESQVREAALVLVNLLGEVSVEDQNRIASEITQINWKLQPGTTLRFISALKDNLEVIWDYFFSLVGKDSDDLEGEEEEHLAQAL
jgi:hypothetical protein